VTVLAAAGAGHPAERAYVANTRTDLNGIATFELQAGDYTVAIVRFPWTSENATVSLGDHPQAITLIQYREALRLETNITWNGGVLLQADTVKLSNATFPFGPPGAEAGYLARWAGFRLDLTWDGRANGPSISACVQAENGAVLAHGDWVSTQGGLPNHSASLRLSSGELETVRQAALQGATIQPCLLLQGPGLATSPWEFHASAAAGFVGPWPVIMN